MLEEINLQPVEKVLEKVQSLITKIQGSSFSWPDRKTFKSDLEMTSILLAQMQQALFKLVAQISKYANAIYGQGVEVEVNEAIHKSYHLLIGRILRG